MPRPTAAQFAYGSATVVVTTLAPLLRFRTAAGIGVAAVGTTALALGLLVAVRRPAPRHRAADGTGRTATAAARTSHAPEGVGTRERVAAGRSPAPVNDHSLRR